MYYIPIFGNSEADRIGHCIYGSRNVWSANRRAGTERRSMGFLATLTLENETEPEELTESENPSGFRIATE